jgi:putative transposase
MSSSDSEPSLRREAIRRCLAGESRTAICAALNRATSWFDKWWAEYRRNPQIDFADRSRAPHRSPQRIRVETERLIVAVRQRLVAGREADTRYECIGNRAILRHLRGLELAADDIPSCSTVQRVLARAGLTQPIGAGTPKAYYPWLTAQAVNDIFATDLIARYVRSKEEVINCHTLDHFSRAAFISQHRDKSAATVGAHVRQAWALLGLPLLHQFDNESAFCGGHTHPRVIGQVVRLCLFCGVEPIFIPFYDPQRNYQIEDFHSLWVHAFWSRHDFATCAEVMVEAPRFLHWYLHTYDPPALNGLTPAQARHGASIHCFDPHRQSLIPTGRLPITAGFIHFMRKVDASAHIELLNERWLTHKALIGCYVRATINLADQQLSIWHKPDEDRDWRLVRTRIFRLQESVHDVLPAFKHNRTRCRDYYPA